MIINIVLLDEYDDFDLYRNIATNVHTAIPKQQLEHSIFKEFIMENMPPKNEIIYVF